MRDSASFRSGAAKIGSGVLNFCWYKVSFSSQMLLLSFYIILKQKVSQIVTKQGRFHMTNSY